ncbi:YqaJ viral recombinase family protein [Sphingomonas flavescens]|uniref:YqaJ viral recombinase family protein n=1 Tax=Sphingomonas flavescens TaxID=3132797 RepID=UPI002805EEC1|nr:YqaJ viral recombinase family protein [Sphingomonas limnosediminicola]
MHRLLLSDQQQRARNRGVGGSDANVILSGHPDRIRELWLEKRGEASPPDLSDKLHVMLGCWTEPFNRAWYEQLTNEEIGAVGESFACERYHWRRCTVDGLVKPDGAIWEAKHTSAFAKNDEVLERYMPQLQHNMAVVGVERAILSVIFGNQRFEIFEIASDWLYQLELLDAEHRFWDCVISGKKPVPATPPPAPRPIGIREVCLEGNNAWASAAFDWLKHREAAKLHSSACASIKSLVEDDVARAFGHGIEAKRSKSGAISIRELA